jgi:hypothetical protein
MCFSFFALTSANADNFTVGASGNFGFLEAKGSETMGAYQVKTSKAEETYMAFGSVYGEVHVPKLTGLRVGLNYVPYALESATTENIRNDNCTNNNNTPAPGACTETSNKVQVDINDMIQTYVSFHRGPVYIKYGIITADLNTNEVLATGSKYGNASLEGQFYGIGIEKSVRDGSLFIRTDAQKSSYDAIRLTSTNRSNVTGIASNTNKINVDDIEGWNYTLSIGKNF